jgi:hypothetical protein
MSSAKDLKLEQKAAAQQLTLLGELNLLVKDIERVEKTITLLQGELGGINSRYQGPRTTREDISYLTALLDCAKKKLAWEKQISSLQKRTPQLLENMMQMLQDPRNPPSEEIRAKLLAGLQAIQASMERLQSVKPQEPAAN